jgi:exopolyphosphatase/guanosine-5'-triphosphate,3'-diphosphate pyrophosphatase
MRRAAIDIGTNSVKLLVADVTADSVTPLWEESQQTRLGQGFYPSHRLQPHAIAASAQVVERFAKRAAEYQVSRVRVIATSAARDAVNRADLLAAVRARSGLEVEVLSGEQEADWAFQGVCTDPRLHGDRLLILDVGGGSTEVILGRAGQSEFRASFPLGTVRLLETLRPCDPPQADWPRCRSALDQFFVAHVEPVLRAALDQAGPGAVQLIGTGGTTSILAAMELRLAKFDRAKIEQTVLTRERVEALREVLWSSPLELRRQVPGLPPDRADVILFGVAIYSVLMERFAFERLRVSTRGIRFGAVL